MYNKIQRLRFLKRNIGERFIIFKTYASKIFCQLKVKILTLVKEADSNVHSLNRKEQSMCLQIKTKISSLPQLREKGANWLEVCLCVAYNQNKIFCPKLEQKEQVS